MRGRTGLAAVLVMVGLAACAAPVGVPSAAPGASGWTSATTTTAIPTTEPTPTADASAVPSASMAAGTSPSGASGAPTGRATASAPAGTASTSTSNGTLGVALFPASSWWHTSVASAGLAAASGSYIAGLPGNLHMDFGANWDGGPFGIPYTVVHGDQPKVPVTFDYADESDPGPYPIPADAAVEGGSDSDGDRHVLVVDVDHHLLYELYDAHRQADGSWHAGSGAIWNLATGAARPAGWTSADAAGLPILPGLVRYDEVAAGHIDHVLRFTVSATQRGYVFPATHWASSSTDASLPPMGTHVRLKADVDISRFPPQAKVILQAMKTYGMVVADNGSNWFVSGAPDPRWDDDQLNTLKQIPGSDFEVVDSGAITTG